MKKQKMDEFEIGKPLRKFVMLGFINKFGHGLMNLRPTNRYDLKTIYIYIYIDDVVSISIHIKIDRDGWAVEFLTSCWIYPVKLISHVPVCVFFSFSSIPISTTYFIDMSYILGIDLYWNMECQCQGQRRGIGGLDLCRLGAAGRICAGCGGSGISRNCRFECRQRSRG